MAGDDGEKGGLASHPGTNPKIRRKHSSRMLSPQDRSRLLPRRKTHRPSKRGKRPPLLRSLPRRSPGSHGSRLRTAFAASRPTTTVATVRNSDARKEDRTQFSSNLEDDCHSEKISDSSTKQAYQYGARDDDAEDEHATIYDGDDQGDRMRRY